MKTNWATEIPNKTADGDCLGWVAHNTRACNCFVDERRALLESELRKPSGSAWPWGVLSAIITLLGVVNLIRYLG